MSRLAICRTLVHYNIVCLLWHLLCFGIVHYSTSVVKDLITAWVQVWKTSSESSTPTPWLRQCWNIGYTFLVVNFKLIGCSERLFCYSHSWGIQQVNRGPSVCASKVWMHAFNWGKCWKRSSWRFVEAGDRTEKCVR